MKKSRLRSVYSVPNSSAKKFQELPLSLLEAYFNPSLDRFVISGPASNIMPTSRAAPLSSDYEPVYLPSQNAYESDLESLFIPSRTGNSLSISSET